MMMRQFVFAGVSVCALTTLAAAEPTPWTLDLGHAYIGWEIDHFGYSNTVGQFRTFDGVFLIDEDNPEDSRITFTIDAASIDSNHVGRDNHLRAADMLNVAEFPDITFTSTSIVMTDATSGAITGDVTFLGTTKPLTLAFAITTDAPYAEFLPNYDQRRAVGFEASGQLDRVEHGLDVLDFPGSPLGRTIDLDIHFDLTDCVGAPDANIPCHWGRVPGFVGPHES